MLQKDTAQQRGTRALPRETRPWHYLVVAIHAGIEEDLDHRLVAVACRQVQRRVLLGVAAQEVGVGVQQHLHHLQPPIERGQVQGGLKLVVAHGRVCELLQEHLYHLRVAVLRGTMQGRLVVVVLRGQQAQGSER